MSLYKKRKKRTYRDEAPFTVRHREKIIFVLVIIIAAGAVAAVNAYEMKRAARLSDYGATDETVTYYYSGSTAEDSAASGAAGTAGAQEGADAAQDSDAGTAGQTTLTDLNAGYPDFSQNEITWKGKTYKRNTYIKPILVLGVDNAGSMHEKKEYGEAGQCDGIFLVAQDTARNSVKLLLIPRDTITPVYEKNPETGAIELYMDGICLSYCFGDGMEESCENSRQAVQMLLMNLPVTDYMAVDTTVISEVNDAVGGVTVTIPTEGMEQTDPSFIYGQSVTLKGKQAESFIRFRDCNVDNSALSRMQQHRQYIVGFFNALKNKSRTDSAIITEIYDKIQDYMVTNMQKERYLKTVLDVLNQGDITENSMLTLPGYGTATDTYDNYYADKDGIVNVVLSMFYREV